MSLLDWQLPSSRPATMSSPSVFSNLNIKCANRTLLLSGYNNRWTLAKSKPGERSYVCYVSIPLQHMNSLNLLWVHACWRPSPSNPILHLASMFFFSFLIISPCIDKLKYHLWKMCLSIKWVKVQCVKPVPEVEIRALLHWVDCSKNWLLHECNKKDSADDLEGNKEGCESA